MEHWNHSVVIYSLLLRPVIRAEFALLGTGDPTLIGFGWDPKTTARMEGYPDNNGKPQLQDLLEFFSPGEDAAALARLAFDVAVKENRRAPPVPPKDQHPNHKVSLQDIMKETEDWQQFINSVIDDDRSPTGVTLLEGDEFLDNATGSWFDHSF